VVTCWHKMRKEAEQNDIRKVAQTQFAWAMLDIDAGRFRLLPTRMVDFRKWPLVSETSVQKRQWSCRCSSSWPRRMFEKNATRPPAPGWSGSSNGTRASQA